jgi:hypothetical protein
VISIVALTYYLAVLLMTILGAVKCPASAPQRQILRIEEGRISGSS